MFEKRFAAIPAQSFTAAGTTAGVITVADSTLFKVKQQVTVSASGQLTLSNLEVKSVLTTTTLVVGPQGGSINTFVDVSSYGVANSASILANEQKRPIIPVDELTRASYEEEPVVAQRSILVDKLGRVYDQNNPLPSSFSGTLAISDIRITAADNDPTQGKVHSSVRISDGSHDLSVNTDGSINVNLSGTSSAAGLRITHNEITLVASGSESNIITITAPLGGYRIQKIEVSGDNVAIFRVKVDGTTISNKRSWWTNFNQTFDFTRFDNGLLLAQGQVLTVTVSHSRPNPGNFETTVMAA